MAIELTEYATDGRKLGGTDTFVAPAGARVIIETSPGGAEILDETVPAGKTWTIGIVIDIQEADA